MVLLCGYRGGLKFDHHVSTRRFPNACTTSLGEASMDLIEKGFAVIALTSFFVLIGVLAWVIA